MRMRRWALVAVLVAASCRSRPESATADPRAVAAAPSATPGKPRICEPTVTCGVWSPCAWLELDHVEPAGYEVFHVAGSDAGGFGSHFWRMHQCWPADAGRDGCALYCDASGTCLDAMTSDGACTATAPPRPSPYVCEVRGAECTTRRDP